MTKINEVYKCSICGNIVEMVHAGAGELVCCGAPMELQQPNTADAAQEKHVPIIESTAEGITVKVGSAAHPMEAAHFIEWIEIMVGDTRIGRQYLQPGDAPEAKFPPTAESKISARAYCNLHGLWISE